MYNTTKFIKNTIAGLFTALVDGNNQSIFYQYNRQLNSESENRKSIGIHMCIQATASIYNPDYEITSSKDYMHIIILSPKYVFITRGDSPFLEKIDPKVFKNTSNHSSAWRSDGLEEINKIVELLEEEVSNKSGKKIDWFITPTPMCSSLFSFVECEYQNNTDGARFQLLSISKKKFSIQIEP